MIKLHQSLVFISIIIGCSTFSNTLRPTSRLQRLNRIALFEAQPTLQETVQDSTIDAPASVVFYDNVPDGVVCARGVCALADFDDDYDDDDLEGSGEKGLVDAVLNSYLGPRLLLAGASILYGTNFPLGAIMNEALPPSAATCARMVLAALALSPFLPKLSPKLSGSAILCGCFTALGYTTQSLALVDVSPATVAFLGAATVIVCPTLEGKEGWKFILRNVSFVSFLVYSHFYYHCCINYFSTCRQKANGSA